MYNYQNITSPRNILKKWCKVELNYIKNDFYRRTVHSKIYVVRMPTNALFINLLAPELFFLILTHPVYKMWTIQEPNKLELWNKLHFEERKKTKSVHHV